jgi:hypothetical protein
MGVWKENRLGISFDEKDFNTLLAVPQNGHGGSGSRIIWHASS